MKLTPVSIDTIRVRGGYRKTKNQTLIEDFLSSGEVCVRFDDTHYKDSYSGYGAIKKSIDLYHYGDSVGITVHSNNLYMYRKESLDE